LLDKLGIEHEVRDVTVNFAERKRIIAETGHHTLPNIFIDGTSIGGSDDLHELADAGKLEHLRKPAA
jgi:glutaredoxin 3